MHVICEQLNCSIKGKESMLSTSGETCNVSSSSAIIILLEQGDLIEMTYVYSYVHQCLQGIHSELYFLECLCRESRYCRILERHAFGYPWSFCHLLDAAFHQLVEYICMDSSVWPEEPSCLVIQA